MGKVTSKLQVTLPKVIADRYRIKPGDELDWTASGDSIRVRLRDAPTAGVSIPERLRSFDEATRRQKARAAAPPARTRGWTREELYTRAGAGDRDRAR